MRFGSEGRGLPSDHISKVSLNCVLRSIKYFANRQSLLCSNGKIPNKDLALLELRICLGF